MRAVLAAATAALILTTGLCVCLSLGTASTASASSVHIAPTVSVTLPITDDLDGFQLPTK
jgi:hypothetical protein